MESNSINETYRADNNHKIQAIILATEIYRLHRYNCQSLSYSSIILIQRQLTRKQDVFGGDGLSVDDVEAEGVAEFPGRRLVVLFAAFQLVIFDEEKPRMKAEGGRGRTIARNAA